MPPTPGCVADAREMTGLLKRRFAFPEAGIRLLINQQATSTAILNQIREWLISPTRPGDRVFLFYAGHGSQLPDDNGDEEDGYDETLAPWDADPVSGEGQIRDDALEPLIKQLSGRRTVCVFDCCHSGTISRGLPRLGAYPQGGGVRYLPRPDQFQSLLANGGSRGYVVGGPGSRDIRPQDPLLALAGGGALPGVVVISAAKPYQLAYPLPVEGITRGALSYTFASVHEDRQPTVRDLRRLLPERLGQLQAGGMLGGEQEPVIEVLSRAHLEDSPLFGTWEQGTEVALLNAVSPIRLTLATEDGKSRYRIGATAHLRVTSDTGGYLYLLAFSANDLASCIFPSTGFPKNQVEPGALFRYSVPVTEPAGRDLVVAVLTKSPVPLGDRVRYTHQEVFSTLNLDALRSAIVAARAGSPATSQRPLGPAPVDWQSSVLALETVR